MMQAEMQSPSNPRALALPTVIAVTLVVQALASMNVIIPSVVAPELAAALGVPGSLIGLQVSCIYIGAMATSMVGGVVVRRYGALRSSQMALLFAAMGGLLTTIPWLLAVALGAFITGLGYGLTNPSSSQMLMKATNPKNRNLVFSIKQTGVPLGGVVAGLIAPTVALQFGWQMALIAGALVSLAMMIVISPLHSSWDQDRDKQARLRSNPFEDAKIVWKIPGLRWMSLAAFSFSAMQVGLSTFVVIMLVTDLNFSLIEAGAVLAVLQVSGVCGRVGWGWLADQSGSPSGVLMTITVITVIGALLLAFFDTDTPPPMIYALLALLGLSAVGWNGVFLAEIARRAPPGMISSATGSSMVVTYAGVMIGPATIAGIYSLVGSYTASFAIFAVVPLAGLFFIIQASKFSEAK